MLQPDRPDDFFFATGETSSVQEFIELAFARAGLNWRDHVVTDSSYLRPPEVDLLVGDPTKARQKLSWVSEVRFKELVELMVEADLKIARREAPLNN